MRAPYQFNNLALCNLPVKSLGDSLSNFHPQLTCPEISMGLVHSIR